MLAAAAPCTPHVLVSASRVLCALVRATLLPEAGTEALPPGTCRWPSPVSLFQSQGLKPWPQSSPSHSRLWLWPLLCMAPPCCFSQCSGAGGCLVLALEASAHPWLGVWPPGTPGRAALWPSLTPTPGCASQSCSLFSPIRPCSLHLPCLYQSCRARSPRAELADSWTSRVLRELCAGGW